MGRPKPLLPFAERSAIELLIDTLLQAGIVQVHVVLGPGGEVVAERLAGWPVRLVWNRAAGSDMAASLRLGAAVLAPACSGVLVALADHPLVASATVAGLIAAHRQDPQRILLPTWKGRSGHPVLLPRNALRELEELPTLREVVRHVPGRVRRVAVDDPGILYDLDTPDDYRQALIYYAGSRRGSAAPE